LADTLHSELMLYGIDVHIYFPATMYTPGFDEENVTKPEIVRKIESTDEGVTPEQAAQALYKGTRILLCYRVRFLNVWADADVA
jgi:3-dehydrosphinganine reductase